MNTNSQFCQTYAKYMADKVIQLKDRPDLIEAVIAENLEVLIDNYGLHSHQDKHWQGITDKLINEGLLK